MSRKDAQSTHHLSSSGEVVFHIAASPCNPIVKLPFGGLPLRLLVDTGSRLSLLKSRTWAGLARRFPSIFSDLRPCSIGLRSASGHTLEVEGDLKLHSGFTREPNKEQTFIICRELPDFPADGILGLDFLNKFRATLDLGEQALRIGNTIIPFEGIKKSYAEAVKGPRGPARKRVRFCEKPQIIPLPPDYGRQNRRATYVHYLRGRPGNRKPIPRHTRVQPKTRPRYSSTGRKGKWDTPITSYTYPGIPLHNRFEVLADWGENEREEHTIRPQETDKGFRRVRKNHRRSGARDTQSDESPRTPKFQINLNSEETTTQEHKETVTSTKSSGHELAVEKASQEPTNQESEVKENAEEEIAPKTGELNAAGKKRTRSPRRDQKKTSKERTPPRSKSPRRSKTGVTPKNRPPKQPKKQKFTAETDQPDSCPVSITGMEHVIPPFSTATVTVKIQSNEERPKRNLYFAPGTPKDGLEIRPRKINPITWPFMEVIVENRSEKPQYLRVGLLVGNAVNDDNQSEVLTIDDLDEGELQEFQSKEGNYTLRWRPPTCLREQLDPVDYLDSPAITFPLNPLGQRNARFTTLSPIIWEPSALPTERTEELRDLLDKNRDTFATDNDPLGICDRLEFRIDTGNAPPARQRPFRVAPSQERTIRDGVNELLSRGLIRESDSEYGAPVVMVPKKNGQLRFCVSYKKLNNQLKNPAWPMPHLFETLTRLGQSKFFSTLDLKSGYHQIMVAEEDQHKTAFVTPWACYEFIVMPFGIKTAPTHFMRVMELVLRDLPNVIVYLDDVLVHSATFEEHKQHLKTVFDRLRKANLKLHPGKCRFAQQRCQFLGHIISKNGVAPNPEKVSAIMDFPVPTDVRKVRQFLGVTSFFRRHIPDYAKIAHPLHQLLRKDNPFIWTAKTTKAFEALKQSMIHAPVLRNPDFEREFIVTSDASSFALGAVLTQQFPNQNGTDEEFPIAFASRTLKPNELNYSVTEKELLAIIFAVQQFGCFVQGKHFLIRCDHRPLQYILSSKTSKSARLERWSLLLQGYNFTTEYRKGSSIAHADALSRNPAAPKAETDESKESNVLGIIDELDSAATIVPQPEDIPEYLPLLDIITLREEQKKDEFCRPYLSYLNMRETEDLEDTTPPDVDKYLLSPNGVLLKEIQVQDGPLTKTCYVAVIPRSLKQEIMMSYHNTPWAGHHGNDKTFRKMAPRVFWPQMRQDIKIFCQACHLCQKTKISSTKRLNPMTIPRLPSKPFDIVAIDIVGPLPPTKDGKRYLMTVLDHLSRYCEAIPLKTQTAEEVDRAFVDQIVCRFGSPKCLISDRGGNFTSRLFQRICTELKIKRVLTTAYHPQANGALERSHRTIKNALTTFVHQNQRQWDEYIPKIMYAFNSTPHTATGFSPGYLLFGRELELPLDLLASQHDPKTGKSPLEWPETIKKMQDSFQWASQRLLHQAEKRKAFYDSSHKAEPHRFKKGDMVLIRRQAPFPVGETPKLGFRYSGPFQVTHIHPPSTLVIGDPRSPEGKRNVHADRAIPFKTPPTYPEPHARDTEDKECTPVPKEIPGRRIYDSSGVMDLSDYSPTAFPDEIPVTPLELEPIPSSPSTLFRGDPFIIPLPAGIPPSSPGISGGATAGDASSLAEPSTSPRSIPWRTRWIRGLRERATPPWKRQRTTPTTEIRVQPTTEHTNLPATTEVTHGYATRTRGPVQDFPLPERWRQPLRRRGPPIPADQSTTWGRTPTSTTSAEPSSSIQHRNNHGRQPQPPVSFIEGFYRRDGHLGEEYDFWWEDTLDEIDCSKRKRPRTSR